MILVVLIIFLVVFHSFPQLADSCPLGAVSLECIGAQSILFRVDGTAEREKEWGTRLWSAPPPRPTTLHLTVPCHQ